jgi:hypothetical protein
MASATPNDHETEADHGWSELAAEVSRAIVELPYLGLPEKVLQITGGILPKGKTFPSPGDWTITIQSTPVSDAHGPKTPPCDGILAALKNAMAHHQQVIAVIDATEQMYWSTLEEAHCQDVKGALLTLIKVRRLQVIYFQARQNMSHLIRVEREYRIDDFGMELAKFAATDDDWKVYRISIYDWAARLAFGKRRQESEKRREAEAREELARAQQAIPDMDNARHRKSRLPSFNDFRTR